MEFSGLWFLYGFLPLTLLAYFAMPDVRRKNVILIAAGLLLCFLCQPVYLPVLLLLCRFNFLAARKIRRGDRRTVAVPIVVNLVVLFLLRYLDWVLLLFGIGAASGGFSAGVASAVAEWLGKFGLSLTVPEYLVPFGLALFVLTAISYFLDIYAGKHRAESRFSAYLLSAFFLPKLFQGPLVRYEQLRPQLHSRRVHFRYVFEGAVRFATGLGKKVLLADFCGRTIGEFEAAGSQGTLVGSWMIAILFFFRIYYDFSGCCDMAVGLARIFGFRIPENFRRPYTALSVTEFLQNWNLTLVSFFRDYLYLPLCLKRKGELNRLLSLVIVVLLGALYHGAGVTFLFWGVYLLAIVLVERYFEGFFLDLPYWLRHVLTILAIMVGWVIFRNSDVQSLGAALKAMAGEGGASVLGDGRRVADSLLVIVLCWIGVTSVPQNFRRQWRGSCGIGNREEGRPRPQWLQYVYYGSCFVYVVLILWWCTVSRTGAAVVPSVFLYL